MWSRHVLVIITIQKASQPTFLGVVKCTLTTPKKVGSLHALGILQPLAKIGFNPS